MHGPAARHAWPALRGHGAWIGLFAMGLAIAWGAPSQAGEIGTSIFVCVDAQGRRLTSDRPIPECLAREQREVSAAGTTLRIIPPSLNADERAREDARAQQEAAQKARVMEDRRLDRALLSRYGTLPQHEAERKKQLQVVMATQDVIRQRMNELQAQRNEWLVEMEFYKANPSQAPAWLRRNLQDNQDQQTSQQRLLAIQSQELDRINARFDEELVRLKQLWGTPASARR